MNKLNLYDVTSFVEKNIGVFHKRRADCLRTLKLSNVLQRKNPYLFKAKNIVTAQDLVRSLLDAILSSQEEVIFGVFLEKLAIYVCSQVFNGNKSDFEGINLEFERDNITYLVVIKSGPNWGNSSQISKMQDHFNQAKDTLLAINPNANIQAINGCCYGRDNKPNKVGYLKLCGQEFWEFISGDDRLFIDIVEPLGYRAEQRNEEFNVEYSRLLNLFTNDFYREFCIDGTINWEKLVRFNSANK